MELGERAKRGLTELKARQDCAPIDGVRGLGSMTAFDVVTQRGGASPDGAGAKRIVERALEQGLILLSCGVSGETIRLLYPLTIEDDQFDLGMARLEAALRCA
jgi:4-aminobutyrate aminotransferase/(S)-3-amino-2-methylpropionate transaminase